METSFLTVNRVDQLSFNENSNQDSVATDQYQDMENDVKGIYYIFMPPPFEECGRALSVAHVRACVRPCVRPSL